MNRKLATIYISTALLCLGACSEPQGWTIDGTISEAPEGTTIAIENYSNGRWLLVDSIRTNANGAFEYKSGTVAHNQELMRLHHPEKGSICFPVDSIDNIHIESSYNNFVATHLSGSPAATSFARVDSIIAAYGNSISPELQRELTGIVTTDTTGIVSYYTVNKSINNEFIFDPEENLGNRVYGAAAQVYAQYKPTDPRGTALRRAYFHGRASLGRTMPSDTTTVIEVAETGIIDIELYDYNGTAHKLSELTSQGKVVLLNFTSYDLTSSPAYNAMLANLYTRYHDNGLEIYQVCFDGNEATWKAAAMNLPWITVWNSPTDGDTVLRKYNVGALPMTFIIGRNGDINSRIVDPAELEPAVERCF